MPNYKSILIGLGVSATIAVISLSIVSYGAPLTIDQEPEVVEKECLVGKSALDIKSERYCLSVEEYSLVKSGLLEDFNDKEKGYDFDVNNLPILDAVVKKETKEKKIKINGPMTKKELRQEIIKLLQ